MVEQHTAHPDWGAFATGLVHEVLASRCLLSCRDLLTLLADAASGQVLRSEAWRQERPSTSAHSPRVLRHSRSGVFWLLLTGERSQWWWWWWWWWWW
jgi:hypothetical protein